VGIPFLALGFGGGRIEMHEVSAHATMRGIASGQEIFRASVVLDQNANGIGEYGLLSDLSEGPSPYIPSSLKPNVKGRSSSKGYCFVIYLPSAGGRAISSRKSSRGDDDFDPSQEQMFLAFAWPEKTGRSGNRIFAFDSRGVVLTKGKSKYSGLSKPPPWKAAIQDANGNGKWDPGEDSWVDGWIEVQ